MDKSLPYILMLVSGLTFCACFSDTGRLAEMETYEGPTIESENVQILVSDSAVIKIKITGPRQLQHQNGDLEFPEGMKAIIYDDLGQPITELTAQHGYQNAGENIYKASGDVLVTNLKKKETLSTEELFWEPDEERIYTEKFVTIETEDALIPGEGLIAPQDFSTYEIQRPQEAIFKIKENNEVDN